MAETPPVSTAARPGWNDPGRSLRGWVFAAYETVLTWSHIVRIQKETIR